ncbi:hypothetical protein A33Q_1855 [Indibacter alkaliphilus LW1]|uniref:PorV/PorQ family protein n=2 Tax=Indibacter TaxID=647744 RepID=S2DCN1_INDAL|nr:hypothetical protein A33Q_1855 [Indibacter alkaliphilus LW1]
MGNTNVTVGDAWSIFNNVGALTEVEESQVFFAYDHRGNLSELTTLAAGMVISADQFSYGISVSTFGEDIFSQSQIGLGVAQKLGIASIGIKASYFQTSIEGFGTGRSAVFELGGIAEITPELFFGAHIYNISGASFGKNSIDQLPSVFKSGISYRPAENIMVNIEVEKDLILPPILKVGVEYSLHEKIWGRIGMNNQPQRLCFGLGFRAKRFHIDFASNQNPYLGNTQHFSFNYLFSRK